MNPVTPRGRGGPTRDNEAKPEARRRHAMTLTVYAIDGVTPVVDPTAYVHPSAVLIGDVIVGPGCYIGPAACLRGDFGRLTIHAGANVQDTCILHAYPGNETVVEEDGHIGHGAVLHGCRIGRNALVGMNAVVNDNAVIGESAIVAAMAFVKSEMIVPARMLAAGMPAPVRALTEEEPNGRPRHRELSATDRRSPPPVRHDAARGTGSGSQGLDRRTAPLSTRKAKVVIYADPSIPDPQ
jgi:phenylacetic acid degradation protein